MPALLARTLLAVVGTVGAATAGVVLTTSPASGAAPAVERGTTHAPAPVPYAVLHQRSAWHHRVTKGDGPPGNITAVIPNLFSCSTVTELCVQQNGPHARKIPDVCVWRRPGQSAVVRVDQPC
ncbi:hypothetical protein EV189_0426 [Motilibacter rhizosphaerae]|uniref:Uncharacterized protein n=1 Tax=Motilibacter rhizosphaerae TaxID=598652 RepID=A0A4Q7NXS1_9ACTN|nr:hypothetical protein [Motilibacter rhizosphaerae]RZS91192.1 hypothetical protein EV189_0426 [Motilibacter rhizosphaerae]